MCELKQNCSGLVLGLTHSLCLPQEGEVPKEIPGESNVIFFKKTFTSCSSRAFKFEYSLEQGMFLAFEEEGGLRKLILKKLSREDEVDETTKISF